MVLSTLLLYKCALCKLTGKGVLVCGEGWVGTRKMRSSQMFYSGPEDTDDYLLVVFVL